MLTQEPDQVIFSPNNKVYPYETGANGIEVTVLRAYMNTIDSLTQNMNTRIEILKRRNSRFEAKLERVSLQGAEGIEMIGPYIDDEGNLKADGMGVSIYLPDGLIKKTLRIDYVCTAKAYCDAYSYSFSKMLQSLRLGS